MTEAMVNEWSVIGLPLLAGLLVLSTHVPLGAQVLRRGIVFIDLAIAQIAALGAILSGLWFGNDAAMSWGAMVAALGGSALIAILTRAWPGQREALIGLVHALAAALALIAISADPHGAQRLRVLLAGDILWVSLGSLVPLAIASTAFLMLNALRPALLQCDSSFYAMFGVLVSLSLPVAGVYLVFASLIAPALATWARSQVEGELAKGGRILAWVVGLLGYGGGLLLSLWVDWPSGPSIVLVLGACALAILLWSGRRRHAD